MHRYTGKEMFIEFDEVPVSGEWMRFEFERRVAVIDVTSVGEADFSGQPSTQTGYWKLTLYDKANGGETVAQALALGASGTLVFGPLGNATGKPKFGFTGIVTGVHQRFAYADTVIYEFEGIKSGAMLYDFGDVF